MTTQTWLFSWIAKQRVSSAKMLTSSRAFRVVSKALLGQNSLAHTHSCANWSNCLNVRELRSRSRSCCHAKMRRKGRRIGALRFVFFLVDADVLLLFTRWLCLGKSSLCALVVIAFVLHSARCVCDCLLVVRSMLLALCALTRLRCVLIALLSLWCVQNGHWCNVTDKPRFVWHSAALRNYCNINTYWYTFARYTTRLHITWISSAFTSTLP